MFRIVHMLHSLAVGGTENGVVNLTRALDGPFHQSVVSMTGMGPLRDRLPAGVEAYAIHKREGHDLRAFARLVLLFRRLRPRVVHSRNWACFDAVLAARLAGVPFVVHGEHGREAGDPQGLNVRRRRIRRLLAPLVDQFVTVSNDLRTWLVDVVKIPETKVVTIVNGVDTVRFHPARPGQGRPALGLGDDVVVVGTVGRLDPVKDQVVLLEALARLEARTAPVVLAIVGDGPVRRRLEERAGSPDLRGKVRLLGERSDIPALLQEFDVFVLPSMAEGISNTILEAMATGLPIVATRTGGNPELVDDAVTGRLVPVGNVEELASAIRAYVDAPGLRRAHGAAARRQAIDRFGLERMATAYRDVYLSLGVPRGQGASGSRPIETPRGRTGIRPGEREARCVE